MGHIKENSIYKSRIFFRLIIIIIGQHQELQK